MAQELCPVCLEEAATVILRTDHGEARLGPKCSRQLEVLVRLWGGKPRRSFVVVQ